VVTWKDQSGNSVDASAVTEGTIYDAGALKKINGTLYIDGGKYDAAFTGSSTGHLFLTLQRPTISGTQRYIATSDSTNKYYFFGYDGSTSGTTNGVTVNSYRFNGTTANSVNRDFIWDNTANQTQATVDVNDSALINRRLYFSSFSAPYYQEFIYYSTTKSTANRADIESNIGDYFTQNTPLLDTYSGAAAAYSLRRLSSTYTGDAVEVYNGSSYADIGFNVFGELDTVALAAHCGSNDGFVSKWYDQSGNTNTAAQTTTSKMPKIYDGVTGVITEGSAGNEKPAVEFDGSDDVLNGSSINPTNDLTMLVVYNCSSSNTFNTLFGQGRGFIGPSEANTDFSYGLNGNNVEPDVQNTNLTGVIGLSASTSRNKQELGELYYSRNANAYVYVDGSLGDSSTTPDYPIRNAYSLSIGAANFTPNARIQEAIVYNSDQNAAGNRANIETNINTFYNIYS
jgi:hypothetical protein